MKTLIATMLVIGWLCALPSLAQSNLPPANHMSHSQLKKLERDANTPQQFKVLAAYYRNEEQKFAAEAAAENAELERRSQNLLGPNAKSPRPVDLARNLYDYYVHQEDQAAKRATGYAARYEESAKSLTAPEGSAP